MGFSHYWERNSDLDIEKFKLWAEDVRKIVNHLDQKGIKIKGRAGKGKPTINEEIVEFNGDVDSDLACENFYIKRIKVQGDNRDKGSCKTDLMPYDIAVGAVLVCLVYRFGNSVRVNSNEGIIFKNNYLAKDGIGLTEKILGINLKNLNVLTLTDRENKVLDFLTGHEKWSEIKIKRNSDKEFDVHLSGNKGTKHKFSIWMPLAIISMVDWTNSRIWNLSDAYGEKGYEPPQGCDWDGIIYSSKAAVFDMTNQALKIIEK